MDESSLEKRIADELQRSGNAVVPGHVGEDRLASLRNELDEALAMLPPYDYPFGRQCRVTASEMQSFELPETTALMVDGFVAAVCARYGARGSEDLVVWSHEYRRDEQAIYGRPHFDRRHQLKAFLYLDDVDVDNGPTHVAQERPEEFHARWIDAWRSALSMDGAPDAEVLDRVRAVPEASEAYRSVACEVSDGREFTPLVGPAGTIVFFDTSLAHFGGLVRESSARRTVRRHCLLD